MQDFNYIKQQFMSLRIPINEHYLDRYIKFILALPELKRKDGYCENHHILPASLFPQYEMKSVAPWNQKNINARAHQICHWILWKALPDNRPMFHAFWCLANIIKDGATHKVNSRAYAKAKIEWSDKLTERNLATQSGEGNNNYGNRYTGKYIASEEYKQRLRDEYTGTITVRLNSTPDVIRIPCESFDESIHQRLEDRKGMMTFRNKITGECALMESEGIDKNIWECASSGRIMLDKQKLNLSKLKSDTLVVKDTATGKRVVISTDEYYSNPDLYSTMNKGIVTVFDITLDKSVRFMSKQEYLDALALSPNRFRPVTRTPSIKSYCSHCKKMIQNRYFNKYHGDACELNV